MAISNADVRAADASDRTTLIRRGYGGSDRTDPSFNRPQYNRYNAISKSRDFGAIDNLSAEVTGVIGGAAGAQTLFFAVDLNGPADLRISKLAGNPREDQYISVGVCGADHKPLALDADGFATTADIHNTDADEAAQPLPAGRYFFTVSSSQWQQLPYGLLLQVLRYRELSGSAGGSAPLVARIALVKLRGAAGGALSPVATIPAADQLHQLVGTAGGQLVLTGRIVKMEGVATGTVVPVGRLKMTYRISGVIAGSAPASGTLTVTSGGYGY